MKLLKRLLLMLLLILLLPLSVRAAGNNSISVIHSKDGAQMQGVVFALYQADASHTGPMEAYTSIIEAGKIPVASGTTDENGLVSFGELEDGVYLLIGEPYLAEGKVCEPEMSLIRLPAGDETDSPSNQVVIIPKYTLRDPSAETTYRVVIIWEDEASIAWRPAAVSVQLFRNGGKYSVIQPDKEGNWQYSWTDSDPLGIWAVLETVPEKYTASYSRDGNTFVITNTLQTDAGADTDTDSKLPQTGQLWWPVPLLAITGFSLVLLGLLRRKERGDEA